jgi:hypothetical protein
MWRKLFILLTAGALPVLAQYEEETEYAVSCSLSMKITVFQPDTADNSGRGYVEVFLCDKNGVPVPNKEVKMVASCGRLSCQAPGWYDDINSISSDKTCFITGANGRVQVYLADVPFNTQGRVKATSFCNEINVSGTGTFMISRTSIKKRTRSKRSTP